MLHANHEDWLSTGTSLRELRQRIEPLMSGAAPAVPCRVRQLCLL